MRADPEVRVLIWDQNTRVQICPRAETKEAFLPVHFCDDNKELLTDRMEKLCHLYIFMTSIMSRKHRPHVGLDNSIHNKTQVQHKPSNLMYND